ncbi:MAG: DmsC/YnfH family molybdoenzyme membrane anchor subunit, partial [Betaproteobacteria bacterium]
VALADLGATYAGWPALASRSTLAIAAAIGLLLVIAGLCSSTLHLANPRNAWRSASRFRTSWLSREAVFALALIPVAAAFVVALWLDVRPRRMWGLPAATLLLAWTVLLCTAMIYASLKPIRQWYTARVPVAYFLLGHASGAVVVESVVRPSSGATWIASAGAALLVASWLAKEEYWRFVRSDEQALSIEDALGVKRGVGPPGARQRGSVMAARLLDTGHSGATFLTREFVGPDAGSRRTLVRVAFFVASVAIPAVWLVAGLGDQLAGAAVAVSCLAGLVAERWLFFADAKHTVRLFHGERRT